MIFKNGRSGDGGAILNTHSSSSITLVNCKFISNYAENNGGAVYTKGDLYVDGCTFESNTVDDDDGGAICALGKKLSLKILFFLTMRIKVPLPEHPMAVQSIQKIRSLSIHAPSRTIWPRQRRCDLR